MRVESAASSGSAPPGEGQAGPPERAVRVVTRLIGRHKLITAAAAIFVAAAIAVSLITSGGSGSPGKSPGDPVAAGFTLTSLTAPGQHITLAQYAGKPLIVNFWASWCEPCQQETPLLAKWYAQQHGHVVLVGLDENDTASSALAFARAKGVSYPIGVDPNLTAANAYGVIALPQTFFLNAQHRIVDHVLGAVTTADLAKGLRLMRARS